MNYAERFRELRREKNLTQAELAELLKISKSCIGMIEIGRNEPTSSTLIAYATFFHVSTDYLLGLEDDENLSPTIPYSIPILTPEEKELLSEYRSLSKPLQDMLKETIKTWKKSNINKKGEII